MIHFGIAVTNLKHVSEIIFCDIPIIMIAMYCLGIRIQYILSPIILFCICIMAEQYNKSSINDDNNNNHNIQNNQHNIQIPESIYAIAGG